MGNFSLLGKLFMISGAVLAGLLFGFMLGTIHVLMILAALEWFLYAGYGIAMFGVWKTVLMAVFLQAWRVIYGILFGKGEPNE